MSTRNGNWFLTFRGTQFFPLDPRPEEIDIDDIAHALSQICRFGGHSREFYSVAQHSLHVARLCPPELALVGLMHDATEAYCGDMIRPIKLNMPGFKEMEDRIWTAVAERFGLPAEIPAEVKHWDDVALMTERRDLVAHTDHVWAIEAKPESREIIPINSNAAKTRFLNEFYRLINR